MIPVLASHNFFYFYCKFHEDNTEKDRDEIILKHAMRTAIGLPVGFSESKNLSFLEHLLIIGTNIARIDVDIFV